MALILFSVFCQGNARLVSLLEILKFLFTTGTSRIRVLQYVRKRFCGNVAKGTICHRNTKFGSLKSLRVKVWEVGTLSITWEDWSRKSLRIKMATNHKQRFTMATGDLKCKLPLDFLRSI